MATFIWDPAVRWPPPANILLNYDVVPPSAATIAAPDAPRVLHAGDVAPIVGGLRVVIVPSAVPSLAAAEDEPER